MPLQQQLLGAVQFGDFFQQGGRQQSALQLKGLEADGGGGAGHGREELETGTALSDWGEIQLSQEAWPDGHPDPA